MQPYPTGKQGMKEKLQEKVSVSVPEAESVLQRYPWFDLPLLAAVGSESLPPRIRLLVRLRPWLLHRTGEETAQPPHPAAAPEEDTLSIIDAFMAGGEHRIVADEHTPDSLPDREEGDLPADDLLTEQLAEIYLAQGLIGQAIEIYRRLSLLNPEKSVYFAEIIEKAEARKTGGKANGETGK